MLIGLQYSEVASTDQPEPGAGAEESPPIQEQIPVNEQPAVRWEIILLKGMV